MRFAAIFVLLLFLIIPFANAIEINPSVESQPIYCRYSFTKWICDFSGGNGGGTTIFTSTNITQNITSPGAFKLFVPNAAATANLEVMRFSGLTNTPSLYLYQLPASAQTSALCFNPTTKEVTYNSGVTTCTASTEKNKKNKATINESVSLKLMNITPYKYTLDLDGETHYGLIAEEIVTTFPELAAHDQYGNYTGVRYEEFTAVLLKGFQEQKARTDKLCAKFPKTC